MPLRGRPEVPVRHNWRGIAAPITRSGGDYFSSKKTMDLIWSSIVLILGTPVGTRIMLPEFGSSIPTLLFEPNDEVLEGLLKRYIIDAIARWEPRVNIRTIAIKTNNSEVTAQMLFEVKGQRQGAFEGNLKLYRGEGFKVVEQFWRETVA